MKEGLSKTLLSVMDPSLSLKSEAIDGDINFGSIAGKISSLAKSMSAKFDRVEKSVSESSGSSSKEKSVILDTNAKLTSIRDLNAKLVASNEAKNEMERKKASNAKKPEDPTAKKQREQMKTKDGRNADAQEETISVLNKMNKSTERLLKLGMLEHNLNSSHDITRSGVTSKVGKLQLEEKRYRDSSASSLETISGTLGKILAIDTAREIRDTAGKGGFLNAFKAAGGLGLRVISSIFSSKFFTKPFELLSKSFKDYFKLLGYRLNRATENFHAKYTMRRLDGIEKNMRDEKTTMRDTLKNIGMATAAGALSMFTKKYKTKGFGKGDYSSLKYGEITWNSQDSSALTTVIPMWLAKIYKALTGESEVWDYKTGTFRTAEEMFKAGEKEREIDLIRAQDRVEFLQKNTRDVGKILEAKEKLKEAQKMYNSETWTEKGARSAVLNLLQGVTENSQTEAQRLSFTRVKDRKPKDEKQMAEAEGDFTTFFEGIFAGKGMDTIKKFFHNNDFWEDIQYVSGSRLFTEKDGFFAKFMTRANKIFNVRDQLEVKRIDQVEDIKEYYSMDESNVGEAIRRIFPENWKKIIDKTYENKSNIKAGTLNFESTKGTEASNTLSLIYQFLITRFADNSGRTMRPSGMDKYKKSNTLAGASEGKTLLEEKSDERAKAQQIKDAKSVLESSKLQTKTLTAVKEDIKGLRTENKKGLSGIKDGQKTGWMSKIFGYIGTVISGIGSVLSSTLGSLPSMLTGGISGLGTVITRGMGVLAAGVLGIKGGLALIKSLTSGMGGVLGRMAIKVGSFAAKIFGLSKISNGIKTFIQGIPFLGKLFGKGAITSVAKKGFLKFFIKKIPVIGAIAGAGFALDYIFQGKYKEAGLEMLSGLASMIPFVGTAISTMIDVKRNDILESAEEGGWFSSSADKISEGSFAGGQKASTDINRHEEEGFLAKNIARNESYQKNFYSDGEGALKGYSIGYGHYRKTKEENLKSIEKILGYRPVNGTLSPEEAKIILRADINDAQRQLYSAFPWVKDQPIAVRNNLTDMAYNLGVGELSKFKAMESIKNGDYAKAAHQLQGTKWYKQVGHRAQSIVSDFLILGGAKTNTVDSIVQKFTGGEESAVNNTNFKSFKDKLQDAIRRGDTKAIGKLVSDEKSEDALKFRKAYRTSLGDSDYDASFYAIANESGMISPDKIMQNYDSIEKIREKQAETVMSSINKVKASFKTDVIAAGKVKLDKIYKENGTEFKGNIFDKDFDVNLYKKDESAGVILPKSINTESSLANSLAESASADGEMTVKTLESILDQLIISNDLAKQKEKEEKKKLEDDKKSIINIQNNNTSIQGNGGNQFVSNSKRKEDTTYPVKPLDISKEALLQSAS